MERIEERLRHERATASTLELDELKTRAMRQATNRTGIRGNLMKSRLALLLMIVAGLMMSTTGATLAITGSSGGDSAATSAYPTDQVAAGQDEAGTLGGDNDAGTRGPSGADDGGSGDDAQEVKQASASDGGDSLPFTGFLAIPLMIGGVALVGGGALLRRRTH